MMKLEMCIVLEITFFPKNFSKFKVDSARWHGWSESRRRKKGFQKRQRSEEPVIVLDRIEENNLEVEKEQDEISRFSDPREEQVKVFEIHF